MCEAELYLHVQERCRILIQLLQYIERSLVDLLLCNFMENVRKTTSLHILKKMRVSGADDGVNLMTFTVVSNQL